MTFLGQDTERCCQSIIVITCCEKQIPADRRQSWLSAEHAKSPNITDVMISSVLCFVAQFSLDVSNSVTVSAAFC